MDLQPSGFDLQASATGSALEGNAVPALDFDRDWPEMMTDIDHLIVPDKLGLYDSPERSVLSGHVYQERIVYTLRRVQSYPSALVQKGYNPFMHRSLCKQDPPCEIQDAVAVSALYAARNEANQALVFTTVSRKAECLIESHNKWAVSPAQHLAAVQALVIYQIIRLFDGDIPLRAAAERDEAVMMDWARHIQLRLKRAESEANEELQAVEPSVAGPWTSWVFAESQRRTVIMCYSVQGLYCFLKNGWDNAHHEFANLSFSAQKALWHAPSEYSWQRAMEKHRYLHVGFPTWDADMQDAEPSDVEELGVMMMVLAKGVDQCSAWLGEKYLDTYGLAVYANAED